MTSDEITVYLTALPVPEEPTGRALLQLSATVTPAAIFSTNLNHSFWYKPAKTKEVFLIKLMIPLPRDGFSRKLEHKAGHRTLHLGKVWYHVKNYASFKFSTSLFSFLYPPSPHPRHCRSAWGRSYENTEALSDSKEEVKYCDKVACHAPWPPTHAACFWRNSLPCPCPAGFMKAVGLKSWMSVTEFFLRISLTWEPLMLNSAVRRSPMKSYSKAGLRTPDVCARIWGSPHRTPSCCWGQCSTSPHCPLSSCVHGLILIILPQGITRRYIPSEPNTGIFKGQNHIYRH